MRFTEYVTRFVRLASKYEEETTGITRIGYLTSNFVEGTMERHAQLGSGIFFGDEASCIRELNANAHRIHAWRSTNSYRHCVTVRRWAYHHTRLTKLDQDVARQQASSSIKSIDVLHQVLRLKSSKNISDSEVYLILRTLADNTKTYEQVTEVIRLPNRSSHDLTAQLLSYLVPYGGGLTHLGFCLFHPRESVREATIQLFNQLRAYPVRSLIQDL